VECAGNPGTLTVSGNATSFVWTPSTGAVGGTLTDSPVTTTSYMVTGSIGDCAGIPVTGTIYVNPVPVISVNNATICEGSSATLTASGATSYVWSPNAGATGNTLTNSPTAPLTSYTVIGTTANCSGTPQVGTIVVNPIPVVTVSSTGVCIGQLATLTASGADTYIWMPGGSVGNSITVPANSTVIYTVTGTTAAPANCFGVGFGTITANPIPTAAFDNPATVVLSEANITFTNQSTGANTSSWDFGDNTTSISRDPQHQYADIGLFNIWLKVVSINGCRDSIMHDIKIVPDLLIYIPNAFTPDGDDLNDGFGFKGVGIDSDGFKFMVFDRWGLLLFETIDLNETWKGDYKGVPCPQDVYVYVVIIKDNFRKEKKYLGQVSLIK